MVMINQNPLKLKDEPVVPLSQTLFNRLVVTLIDQSKLAPNMLARADNCWGVEDGAISPRPGTGWYGTSPTVTPPGALAGTLATGTALGIGVYIYIVTFVNAAGETIGGTPFSITTTSGNQDVNLSAIPLGPGATTGRNIYRTPVNVAASGAKLLTKIADNTTTTFADTTPDASLGIAIPTTNTATAPIDGSEMFIDSSSNPHLVLVAGGNIFRSLDNAQTWVECPLPSGVTLTPGAKCTFRQANGFLYIVNGHDQMVLYNGTTSIQAYVALTTPTGIGVAKTGLSGTGIYTYYYRIVAVNAVGFTAASSSSAGQILVDRQRVAFDGSDYVTITWGAVSGALRYDIYVGDISGQETYLDSIAPASGSTPTYIDKGQVPTQTSLLAPSSNTTTGPVLGRLQYVGDRLWGTGDPNNKQRTYWTGSGPYIGYFATAYDGGYIDLNVGSQFTPVDVQDYRNGQGVPYTNIWSDSADGIGCVWQVQLQTQTVQNLYSFTVPYAYKIPGSRGTSAPFSVVNVLNDFMYYNSQAFYNLGSRAQFLNLLSTDESSANIRSSVLQINPAAAHKICGFYWLKKVLMSVPYGTSANNNAIVVYDTERQGWLPYAFTYGVERFFYYRDTNQTIHVLVWKPGDAGLSEISFNFKGDYGQGFPLYLLTGLMPVNPKDRMAFMFIDEADIELSNPQGLITGQLIGIDRNVGYSVIDNFQMGDPQIQSTNIGWDTFPWDSETWDYINTLPTVFSQASDKGWFPVTREINAYQWLLTSNSQNINFTTRLFQLKGMYTNAGNPPQWRLTTVPNEQV